MAQRSSFLLERTGFLKEDTELLANIQSTVEEMLKGTARGKEVCGVFWKCPEE